MLVDVRCNIVQKSMWIHGAKLGKHFNELERGWHAALRLDDGRLGSLERHDDAESELHETRCCWNEPSGW